MPHQELELDEVDLPEITQEQLTLNGAPKKVESVELQAEADEEETKETTTQQKIDFES